MRGTLIICPDAESVSREAAARFVAAAAEKLADHRATFAVALAGGSTPRRLYELLAGSPFRSKIPWARVHFFWGDERLVPLDHADSNFRMAHEALLRHVPAPPANIHAIPTNLPAEQAALAYEQTLRTHFGRWGLPGFDLVLLGVGSDGHTASLFPGSAALAEKERWVMAHSRGVNEPARVTLTLPVFNHASRVHFLVTGKPKASALRAALERGALPVQRVQPKKGELLFLADAAATAKLDRVRIDVPVTSEAQP
ncbi:MAG: 6-phosphogluconolactonase [Candidatus Acidiferrales bacterium]